MTSISVVAFVAKAQTILAFHKWPTTAAAVLVTEVAKLAPLRFFSGSRLFDECDSAGALRVHVTASPFARSCSAQNLVDNCHVRCELVWGRRWHEFC